MTTLPLDTPRATETHDAPRSARVVPALPDGVTYDPRTTGDYTAPYCVVDAPGGPAWFGSLAEVERWRERQGREKGR